MGSWPRAPSLAQSGDAYWKGVLIDFPVNTVLAIYEGARMTSIGAQIDNLEALQHELERIGEDGYIVVVGQNFIIIKDVIVEKWNTKRGRSELITTGVAIVVGPKLLPKSARAPKSATRTLDKPDSLRGARPREIEELIPDNWTRKQLKKGEGDRYLNPDKNGEAIMIEKGTPGAKDPLHAGPYVRISRDGTITRIPLKGNPTLE